ncbi:MAG: glycoside hydrolase family 3 protein, partial [Oscillospiraceae bacterium]
MDDFTLKNKIEELSLYEKALLCCGASAWTTRALPERGIPSLFMADGPHGLRVETTGQQRRVAFSFPTTCFPTAGSLACSWDTALLHQVGAALGQESKRMGVGMLLAPGVNIKRSPLCGRNFEYYAEDPILSGHLGAAFVQGVQEQGVGTSLKHYAVNSQETLRLSIDSVVDTRALFDLYLKAFEIVVKESAPATVMCSYNRINGTYASENHLMLTDILRMQFGFTGAVVSDWGAVNNRAAGIAAGLDLEMPYSGDENALQIVNAVEEGALSENALDAACWNML